MSKCMMDSIGMDWMSLIIFGAVLILPFFRSLLRVGLAGQRPS